MKDLITPRLKRWYAVIDDPEAAVLNVSLYSNHKDMPKGTVALVEIPHLARFLSEVNNLLKDCHYSKKWYESKRWQAIAELEKANARIKELEEYINNAGEE